MAGKAEIPPNSAISAQLRDAQVDEMHALDTVIDRFKERPFARVPFKRDRAKGLARIMSAGRYVGNRCRKRPQRVVSGPSIAEY